MLRQRGLAVGSITSRCSGERRKSSLQEEKHVTCLPLWFTVLLRHAPYYNGLRTVSIIHVTLRDKPDICFLMGIISLRIVWQIWPSSAKNLIEDGHPSSLGRHITDDWVTNLRHFAFMWRCVTKRTLEKNSLNFPNDCVTNLTLVCQKWAYRPSSIVHRLSSRIQRLGFSTCLLTSHGKNNSSFAELNESSDASKVKDCSES